MNTAVAPGAAAPLLQRVKNILLAPRTEWPVIRGEPATVQGIYTGYLCLIALVPAIAGFIGLSLVGVGGFGVSFKVPIVSGLVNMVVGYVLWLATAYLLALIVNALAPTFGGQKDMLAAFKVVAYSLTAAWLGGIFTVLPALSMLGLLAALYSIYLLYTGLPVLMQSPPDKAVGYTAVTVLCGFVLGFVIAAVTAMFMPGPMMSAAGGMAGSGSAGDVTIKTPGGEINIDARKMEEFAKKMEAAGKKMEEASKSGDMGAVAKAGAELAGTAATSAGGRAPINAQELKAMLPDGIAGLKRESLEAQGNEAGGLSMSSARAEYGSGNQRATLAINDAGALAGLAGMANWMNVNSDKETADRSERVYKQGNRTVREQVDKRSKSVEYSMVLPNGVIVEAEGDGVDLAALKKAVDGLPLAKLEGAK